MGLPLFRIRNLDSPKHRYDINVSVLVAAASEEVARVLMASVKFYADDPTEFTPLYAGDEGPDVWNDPEETPAEQIAPDSIFDEPTVVMRDFRAG